MSFILPEGPRFSCDAGRGGDSATRHVLGVGGKPWSPRSAHAPAWPRTVCSTCGVGPTRPGSPGGRRSWPRVPVLRGAEGREQRPWEPGEPPGAGLSAGAPGRLRVAVPPCWLASAWPVRARPGLGRLPLTVQPQGAPTGPGMQWLLNV